MKLKSYLFIGLAALALASCDESFDDWTVNPDNQPGTLTTFGAGSVTAADPIDFGAIADDVTLVKVCNIVAPTSNDTAYTSTYQLKFSDQTFDLNADGTVSRSELEDYVTKKYGKQAVQRTTKGVVIASVSNGATATRFTSDTIEVKTTVKAPTYGELIYLRGGGDWGTDRPLYGPDFDGKYVGYYYLSDNFKFKPNAGNDWTGDFGHDPNGAANALIEDGEEDCQLAAADAGFYRIDVDMAAMTYSITKISKIGFVGSAAGSWDDDKDMTYNATTGDWEWTGDLTTGAIKFRADGSWTHGWGGKANGTDYDQLTESNGQDLTIAEAGTYKITLTLHQEKDGCKVSIVKQ